MNKDVKTLDDGLGSLDSNALDSRSVDYKPAEQDNPVLQNDIETNQHSSDKKSESSDVPKPDKPKGKPGPKPKPKDVPNISDKPKDENPKADNASKPDSSAKAKSNIDKELVRHKPIKLFISPAAKSFIAKSEGVYTFTGQCVNDMISVSKVVKGVGKVNGWIKKSDYR